MAGKALAPTRPSGLPSTRSNARTIRSAARPDARARRLAADFTRLFTEWPHLLPAERQARLEAIANRDCSGGPARTR